MSAVSNLLANISNQTDCTGPSIALQYCRQEIPNISQCSRGLGVGLPALVLSKTLVIVQESRIFSITHLLELMEPFGWAGLHLHPCPWQPGEAAAPVRG